MAMSGRDGGEAAGPARWGMTALSASMLLASLGASSANVGLPALAQGFGAAFQAVQWIVLAYLLASTVLVVGAGRLGDLVGRRRLLLGGLALFAAASVACGVAPSLPVLIAARAAQGAGAAAMLAMSMALAGEAVPKAKIGAAMGLLGTMSAVGTALGPSLGGALIAAFGWRAIFLVNIPLGAAALGLAWRGLPSDGPARGAQGFDGLGTGLLAATLTAYALAMTLGGGRFGALNLGLLATAAVGAGLFVLAQARAASPLIRLEMFRDPGLGASLTAGALVATVLMATLVVGPFHLARGLGLGAVAVGAAMSLGPLVAALSGAPAGRLADRLGAGRMAVVGLVGIGTGAALLAVLPARLGVGGYVVPVVLITAHYALFQAANTAGVMAKVAAERRGVVSGLLALSRNLGLITGASLMGAVFAHGSGARDIATASPQAVTSGLHSAFAVAAALIGVALAVTAAGALRSADRRATLAATQGGPRGR